jgi:hypothetical protein
MEGAADPLLSAPHETAATAGNPLAPAPAPPTVFRSSPLTVLSNLQALKIAVPDESVPAPPSPQTPGSRAVPRKLQTLGIMAPPPMSPNATLLLRKSSSRKSFSSLDEEDLADDSAILRTRKSRTSSGMSVDGLNRSLQSESPGSPDGRDPPTFDCGGADEQGETSSSTWHASTNK